MDLKKIVGNLNLFKAGNRKKSEDEFAKEWAKAHEDFVYICKELGLDPPRVGMPMDALYARILAKLVARVDGQTAQLRTDKQERRKIKGYSRAASRLGIELAAATEKLRAQEEASKEGSRDAGGSVTERSA